jgi:EmrB/QacA subfamily drug resistance transporter
MEMPQHRWHARGMSEQPLTFQLETASPLSKSWSRLRGHPWAALAVLMCGTFMFVLDFFIVNVALPSLRVDLHASASSIEWVVAGYGLTLATFLITAGRLGDQIGRRRMFCAGLALFTLTSAACGVAPSAAALLGARLAQGFAAALMAPSVLSIIGVAYTGHARVKALSVYGMVMGLAAVGGQLIGGALIQADPAGLGWRTCFLINVPIGVAALALAPALVPESKAAQPRRPDAFGSLLVTLGLVAIVLPLVDGRQLGWPTWTWLSLGAAPIVLGAAALQQRWLMRRGGAPLLAPELLRERAYSAGLVTQLVFWCGQGSFFLVLALYLQPGRGYSPLQAGLVFTILAAAYLATSLRAPALAMRYGRGLVALGAATLAAGHAVLLAAVLDVGTGGSLALLVPGLVLIGAGMGLCVTPLTSIVMSTLPPQHAGAASGALSTVQQLGNALGVAVIGVIFFGAVRSGYARAFELSLAELAALLLVVAALTLTLLPRRTSG